jgi:hypothetical protein
VGVWKIACSSKTDNAELRALYVTFGRDAWAVGRAEDDWGSTFFVHYDVRQWRDYDAAADLPKPNRPARGELASSGPRNAWFLGTDNPMGPQEVGPVIACRDGSRRRDVPLPPRMTERVKNAAILAPAPYTAQRPTATRDIVLGVSTPRSAGSVSVRCSTSWP